MFNNKKFLQTSFLPREEGVPVPDMKDYFDKDEDPVWIVRGLGGTEIARTNEAVDRNKNVSAILEGLVANNKSEKIKAVKQLIGIDEKVPNEIAKRIEQFILGSVKPVASLDLALKICKVFPIEFYQITNKITLLTGQGHVPGKPKASGEIQK